ncbi:MAG: DUF488 domain-containing protein [Gammaproteobacteria bacterium]|nr:DUF488 domain-containing protein [Gammaproteobacteria bacterium]
MTLHIKRVYEKPTKADGFRVLIDRLWPRGIKKEAAEIDLWIKDIAPSDALRKWFGHKPIKRDEFKSRYFRELDQRPEWVSQLVAKATKHQVTLVYASKEEKFNNAVALKEYLEQHWSRH